jgi:hypothetical protein
VTSIGGSGYVVSPLDGVNVWNSDLEGLAAYVAARQSDTHRTRLGWIKAKMFVGSSECPS